MQFLAQLWLPIILSGVFVFIWSALTWTVLPWHNKEWKGLPNAEGVRDLIKKAGWAPGQYAFPWWDDPKQRRSPEAMAKMAEGPSGHVIIMKAGPMNMGPMMAKSLLANIVVSFFAAYVVWHGLGAYPQPYLRVFRLIGCVGFMSYAFGSLSDSIWFGRPWKVWLLQAFDALIMGLLMGGTFGWLWPH